MIGGTAWGEIQNQIFDIKFDFNGFWDSLNLRDQKTLKSLIEKHLNAKESKEPNG